MTIRATMGALGASVMLGAAVPIGDATAAGRSYDLSNRALIEQDIRRSYNNYNRNIPTSPLAPRIRERHLRDGVLPAPSGNSVAPVRNSTDVCAYAYGRWKRSNSNYWRERYRDCAG